jgi:hypothetical protein
MMTRVSSIGIAVTDQPPPDSLKTWKNHFTSGMHVPGRKCGRVSLRSGSQDLLGHRVFDRISKPPELGWVKTRVFVCEIDRQGWGAPLRHQVKKSALCDVLRHQPSRNHTNAKP